MEEGPSRTEEAEGPEEGVSKVKVGGKSGRSGLSEDGSDLFPVGAVHSD